MSDCAAPRPISSPIEQPATGRILIVEAEHETRRALHGALHERGFDVLDVSSGDKALGLARTIGFDAVILGISVPVSGGIEACRELRRILPLLGIIAVGPRVDEAGRIAVLDSGADDYVVKPYLLPELTSRIRAMCAARAGEAVARRAVHPDRRNRPVPRATCVGKERPRCRSHTEGVQPAFSPDAAAGRSGDV
jgi:DNA-binding response OmpR family regulator